MTVFLDVSDDLLTTICDFLQARQLSQVCQRTWQVLQRRYARYSFTWDNITASLICITLHVVHLQLTDMDETSCLALVCLNDAPILHTLNLNFIRSPLLARRMGDDGAIVLARLKASLTLHTLTIHLVDNKLGDVGAAALSSFKDTPSLHELHLHLKHNEVGDVGAAALASLKHARALQVLTLDLSYNGVGHQGLVALASSLVDAPSLQTLTINLRRTPTGNVGAQALSSLRHSTLLHNLVLDLAETELDDVGA